MTLSIIALCIFIFGAYAYGSVVVLSLRQRAPVWTDAVAPGSFRLRVKLRGLAMFVVCTAWFILHSVIEFRHMMGQSRTDDWIDLAALELVFTFPGLILHTVLMESAAGGGHPPRTTPRRQGGWAWMLLALYGAGAALAIYFPAAMFGLVPAPRRLSPYIGFSIGALFTVSSICCLLVMRSRRNPTVSPDQRNLRRSMATIFMAMIALFFVLTFMRGSILLIEVIDVVVRTLPLVFLLVSVYFENRIEFYDLIIKRGVVLLITLLVLGSVLTVSLGWVESLPAGVTRPWLFAVVLLPVAMLMSALHHRIGRILDRLWFGREFTPVEAVKHVLAGMQQATDEVSLVVKAEATLSEMFRTRVLVLLEDQPTPDTAVVVADVRGSQSSGLIRLAIVNDAGCRTLLSEDHAMLRSLGGVFGFMLENVRLQRKRQEQETVAQELRLQSSRSELKALRAQINPHFLFNALNAIASLIHTDPARADAAVEQLAEVFRYTLRRSEQEWAPLDQELAFARAYLDVEQARFGQRLEFSITSDPGMTRAQVPSMLLHTLVENAVKHGISRLRAPGRIDVRAQRREQQLVLEVRDSGPGPDAANRYPTAPGEHFGLRSVRDRLHGHFGAHASLTLSRDSGTTQTVARLEMPFVTEDLAASTR
ncbi:MAG TPA: histidine kinase [Vicinamibacterales bacterium]|nr:histidine kinase [Vicinamibacterales bacterium]